MRVMTRMRLYVPVQESYTFWHTDAGYCLDRSTDADRG